MLTWATSGIGGNSGKLLCRSNSLLKIKMYGQMCWLPFIFQARMQVSDRVSVTGVSLSSAVLYVKWLGVLLL
jgi:hypothetical protein